MRHGGSEHGNFIYQSLFWINTARDSPRIELAHLKFWSYRLEKLERINNIMANDIRVCLASVSPFVLDEGVSCFIVTRCSLFLCIEKKNIYIYESVYALNGNSVSTTCVKLFM